MSARAHETPPGDRDARSLARLRETLDALGPIVERVFAPKASGVAHLRTPGPALIVGNHSGGVLAMLEPIVLAHTIRAAVGDDALPRTLAHEILWHTPIAGRLEALGAVRASPVAARALLDAGHKVLVYPGGDREAFRSFAARDEISLGDHRGYVRLALSRRVPIVPVVTAGMHSGFLSLGDGHALARAITPRALKLGVLPVTLGFPFGLSIGVPAPYLPIDARVRIRALPPIRFTRSGDDAAADVDYVEACHRVVTRRMQLALDELAASRRAERRAAVHAGLDGLFDRIERWTHARSTTVDAALPRALGTTPSPSLVFRRAS